MRLLFFCTMLLVGAISPLLAQQYEQLNGSIMRLNTAIELEYFLRTAPKECVTNSARAVSLVEMFNSAFPDIREEFKPTREAVCDYHINFAKRQQLNKKLAEWVGLIRIRAQLVELKGDTSADGRKLKQNLSDCLCRAKKNKWLDCVQLLEAVGITLDHSTECDPET